RPRTEGWPGRCWSVRPATGPGRPSRPVGGRETHREARRLGTGPLLITARGGGCRERPAGGAGGRGFAQSAPAEEGVPRGIAGRAGPFDPRGGGSPADRRAGQGGRLRAGGGGAP